MREHDQDYVDACRSRVESQIGMFREVAQAARDHGDADVSGLEGALESLEYEYFNNMLLVLDASFPSPDAGPGTAVAEVRALARSLMEDGGTLAADPETPGAPGPGGGVLGLRAGDPITLTLQQFRRISDAFFREIESRTARSDG
ncbi:hypothetical protein [Terrabacter sp. NPDC000476]|uniref:hypothetical protein n=1 Tax=Terrabacter sp. NPDC000476 TaxID=3154258 RepID=UPI00332A5EDF